MCDVLLQLPPGPVEKVGDQYPKLNMGAPDHPAGVVASVYSKTHHAMNGRRNREQLHLT